MNVKHGRYIFALNWNCLSRAFATFSSVNRIDEFEDFKIYALDRKRRDLKYCDDTNKK